jgi:hypothetical protein
MPAMSTDCDTIDLVRELRLRTWARLHFVPLAERSRNWHPLVLAEMAIRDAEIEQDRFIDEVLAFVLDATESAVEIVGLESGSISTSDPEASTAPVALETSTRDTAPVAARAAAFVEAPWPTRVLATFVPLAPGPYHRRVDEPHAGPAAPHVLVVPARPRATATSRDDVYEPLGAR